MISTNKSAAAAHRREVPVDDKLPGLSTLLDAGSVESVLQAQGAGGANRLRHCRIAYLRYKPLTNCLVAYTAEQADPNSSTVSPVMFYAKCYTVDDFPHAVRKAETNRWVKLPQLPSMVILPECCAIIYFFPNDCRLDGLRILAFPKKMQRIMYNLVPEYSSLEWRISDRRIRATTVRYKPEKRAVIRIETRVTNKKSGARHQLGIYLRTYFDDRGAVINSLMSRLHHAVSANTRLVVPRPLGYLPHRKALFIEELAGDPLTESLGQSDHEQLMTHTSEALAILHRCNNTGALPYKTAAILQDTRTAGEALAYIVPELRGIIDDIMSRLERTAFDDHQSRVRFVHGDFYHGQILLQNDHEVILDFDRSYLGDPAADVGNFCAHLRLLRREDRIPDDRSLAETFVESYRSCADDELETGRLKFWTALGLFLLAVRPFRNLAPDWRRKVEAILDECRAVIS